MRDDALSSIRNDDVAPRRLVAFPDGSVDRFHVVDGLDGERLRSRVELGRQLRADDGDSFSLHRRWVRPGGQAVNAAMQWHALGEEPVLVSHLDHPVLADLPFETHSMGEPTPIDVLSLDGDDVLLARDERSDEWCLADLLTTVRWDRLAHADGIFCGNWIGYPGLTGVFERLASDFPMRVPLVFDPGPLRRANAQSRRRLYDALASADSTVDVTMSVNRAECDTVATDLEVPAQGRTDWNSSETSISDVLGGIRAELDIDAVVYHGTDRAVAATVDDVVQVETVDVGDPIVTTGAGDRFSAGVASALARGCSWDGALALGNACASHYVSTAETAGPESIEAVLDG